MEALSPSDDTIACRSATADVDSMSQLQLFFRERPGRGASSADWSRARNAASVNVEFALIAAAPAPGLRQPEGVVGCQLTHVRFQCAK